MPHHGQYEHVKEHYLKQPIAVVSESPPVQNTWYVLLDTTLDVRLLSVCITQTHTEAAALMLEVRWISDGIVQSTGVNADDDTIYHVHQDYDSDQLATNTAFRQAGYYTDVRRQSLRLEVRMTGVPGTAQTLEAWAQYETLETT